jgi:2-dehydro-3-deoxyphosphogalactonate aldolase
MAPDPPATEHSLVAILRGVQADRVVAIADVLYSAGIRAIEVPLNSPGPFASISALATSVPAGCLIGAGTVLDVEDVRRTHAAGGRLVVSPNCNVDVIREALQRAMLVMPGVATATEAFTAISAGATLLKLFPAVSLGPPHLRALAAVLPATARVFPVGGVGVADIYDWLAAGAAGFGLGSELFRPDYTLEDIGRRARHLVQVFHEARHRLEQQQPLPHDTRTINGVRS